MNTSYWAKVTSKRVSRRRTLGALGGGALGAAFLAACGDDDDASPATTGGSTGTTGSTGAATGGTGATGASTGATGGTGGSTGATGPSTSGLIRAPQNTLAQAKAGGVIKDFYTAELTHMDALLSNSASTVNLISVFAYPS